MVEEAALLAGLTEEEREELRARRDKIVADRGKKDAQKARCQKCGKAGRFEEAGCPSCQKRIQSCVECGDKSSEELCPDCIAAGLPVCEFCLRPPVANGGKCKVCLEAEQQPMASDFDEAKAIPPISQRAMMEGTAAGL